MLSVEVGIFRSWPIEIRFGFEIELKLCRAELEIPNFDAMRRSVSPDCTRYSTTVAVGSGSGVGSGSSATSGAGAGWLVLPDFGILMSWPIDIRFGFEIELYACNAAVVTENFAAILFKLSPETTRYWISVSPSTSESVTDSVGEPAPGFGVLSGVGSGST